MSIGFSELVVIGLVMIIVFHPSDWPKLIRKIGYWYGQIQKMITQFTDSVRSVGEVDTDEDEKGSLRQ